MVIKNSDRKHVCFYIYIFYHVVVIFIVDTGLVFNKLKKTYDVDHLKVPAVVEIWAQIDVFIT